MIRVMMRCAVAWTLVVVALVVIARLVPPQDAPAPLESDAARTGEAR